MGRIVYCAWLIPCDYRVRLVHDPAQLLGGGRRVVYFVLTFVRAKLALGPVRSWFTRRVSDRATQHKNHSFVVYTRVDPSVIITFVIESGSPIPPSKAARLFYVDGAGIRCEGRNSPTSAERSRAVSLVTSFGSCGSIYEPNILPRPDP
jgi:hypothetical protein